jgi:hypothetical protein
MPPSFLIKMEVKMRKKIEKLTDQQKARFGEFVERWTKIGLSTELANRPLAEEALIKMYKIANLAPPKIVWCGSPLSMALTRGVLLASVGGSVWASVGASVGDSVWDSVRASVGDSVWDSVRDSVGDSVWASVRDSVRASVGPSVWDSVGASVRDSVRDSVGDSVGDSVRDSVRASVGASVWDSVGASVRDSVRDSVGDSVWASVWASVGASVYGQHDAEWLAFYSFFNEVLELKKETEKLEGLCQLAQNAGWALPHKNLCWIAERHTTLNRDERGLLHSLRGPACVYPDGWGIYAVHGVRVKPEIIEKPHLITTKQIDQETNAEIKRVMIDQFRCGEEINGPAAYIKEVGAKRLDHNESFGTLWHRNMPNDEPIVMLEVVNSTPEPDGKWKHYFLRVPPTITTAHEASAWTFNMKASEYKPEIET